MVFEIIKKIKEKEYRYLVKGIREGKKVRHKFVKYLGPVKPINKTEKKKSTGRKPYAFVRGITEEERQQLENATKSNIAFTRERAKIILYSADELKVSKICEKTGKEKRSVSTAIRKFNEKGISSLQRGKTTGPKRKFTEEQRAKMIEVVNTDPRKLGKNFTSWSLPKLKQHIIESKTANSIAIETMRQILKKGNKKYKKSRKWLYSNDPEFSKKS